MDVYVLNREFETVDIIDAYDALIWAQRYSDCGDFEFYVPASREKISVLQPDYYLQIAESPCTMIIEGLELRTNADEDRQYKVNGRSLGSILHRRIVWPQTKLSGNVHNALKTLLNNNIGVNAGTRRITNFKFVDSTDTRVTSLTFGSSPMQFTGDDLYDAVKIVCDRFGLGFRIVLSDNNEFEFSLYMGEDRTSENQNGNEYVLFSPETDTLLSSNYTYSKSAMKTIAYIAGEGEGTERVTEILDVTEDTGLDRRELYVDARDISSNAGTDDEIPEAEYRQLLQSRGINKIIEHLPQNDFEAEPDTQLQYKFGQDYFIGDLCELENEYGLSAIVRVTEVIVSDENGRFEIYPTFSTIEE